MKIVSIQVGKPQTLTYNGQDIVTGITKKPVNGPLILRTFNLEGDGQADLNVHGGRDKALYAYAGDVYPEWKKLRPQDSFLGGAMGENLTLDTLPEDKIYIGDTFELGEAVVQVTEPRFPCYKLAALYNDAAILKQFMKIGRPGVYFSVLREGMFNTGDALKLLSRESVLLSIKELFILSNTKNIAPDRALELQSVQGLSQRWKEKIKGWN